jgi:hypothetical protein
MDVTILRNGPVSASSTLGWRRAGPLDLPQDILQWCMFSVRKQSHDPLAAARTPVHGATIGVYGAAEKLAGAKKSPKCLRVADLGDPAQPITDDCESTRAGGRTQDLQIHNRNYLISNLLTTNYLHRRQTLAPMLAPTIQLRPTTSCSFSPTQFAASLPTIGRVLMLSFATPSTEQDHNYRRG